MIGNQKYAKGDDVPWLKIYPIFLLQMLFFGGGSLWVAYGLETPHTDTLYGFGAITIFIYMVLYLIVFGIDEIKWLFINSFLGFAGIYIQLEWIVSLFNKNINDYPLNIHVVPFIYYILYTFLIRQLVLDLTNARYNLTKKKYIEISYILISLAVYIILYFSLLGTEHA